MTKRPWLVMALTLVVGGTLLANPLHAQQKEGQPTPASSPATVADPSQPGENHQLLAELVGTWECHVTMWMIPGAPPIVAVGTAVRKSILDGRYFVLDSTMKMPMPGADGQMHPVDYKGVQIDGFDNLKGKFFAIWMDNMGTGTLSTEGTYDPASKTFTYHGEEEMEPGKKTPVRGVVKVTDKDHYSFEWYQEQGGKESKVMEIAYTRQK